MERIVEMSGVDMAFDGRPALSDLGFEVYRGEVFGFLGPSGAGKTTTIKLLTRQLRAQRGDIRVFGQPIESLPQSAFDQIGVLTDSSGLYERLSVRDNLTLFAALKGLAPSAADQALARVGLEGEGKKPAQKLSRGMKQRLMLARAVLHRPRLLFLDEPTAALDPATIQQIHALLRALNEEGTTIFLTTHNMEEADRLCHRVAFLNHGSVVECAAPAALKLKYAQNKLVGLAEDGERIEEEKSAAGLIRLAGRLGERKLITLHSNEPNLEEIFLHLTGRSL